jgi:hypothetical protein
MQFSDLFLFIISTSTDSSCGTLVIYNPKLLPHHCVIINIRMVHSIYSGTFVINRHEVPHAWIQWLVVIVTKQKVKCRLCSVTMFFAVSAIVLHFLKIVAATDFRTTYI